MKKRFLPGIIAVCCLLLSGCGQTGGKPGNLASYVKLGPIRDLGVEYVKTEITEEDMQEAIQEDLESMADYRDKSEPAEMGDMIDLLITATADNGEVLYDFSEDAYDMTIGDGDWGEEFDALLVGAKVGDSGQVTYTYDADFEDMVLCGHKVTLDYKVDRVYIAIVPELDEAFLTEMGYSSEDEYRNAVRKSLEEDNEYSDREEYIQELLDAVKESSEFSKIPKNVLDYAKACVKEGYEGYADMLGYELEDVYEMLEVSDDELTEESLDYAKDLIVIDAIRQSEGIEIDNDTYDKKLAVFMEEEDYDNITEVYEDYERSELEDLFLEEMVKDHLVEINSKS